MYKIKSRIRKCKDISNLGDFIRSNNIKLVLFGEYHGFVKQIKIQRKMIQSIKPDFFIYEMLENSRILNNKEAIEFMNKPDINDFSVVSTYGQLKPIIKLARSFNLPIIGCDLKNMGVPRDWRKIKFSNKEAKEITRKREFQQARIINQYASKGIVFALLGNYHLRKKSLLLSKLKNKKFIIVKPSFKWDEKFNDSKKFKNSDVSYIVDLVDEVEMTYIIPFKKRPVKIGQRFNQGSHRDWPEDKEDMTYSIDFLLPEGTEIIASRSGVVTKVKQDGKKNYSGKDLKKGEEAYKNQMNEIEIKHKDGTFALYAHLKHKGIFVKVGDKVKQGQLIGLSGNTGWSSAPHLDFSVFRKDYKNRKIKTIKFKFKDFKGSLEREK